MLYDLKIGLKQIFLQLPVGELPFLMNPFTMHMLPVRSIHFLYSHARLIRQKFFCGLNHCLGTTLDLALDSRVQYSSVLGKYPLDDLEQLAIPVKLEEITHQHQQ